MYLSTRLSSGEVRVHAVVSKTCMMGVGRLPTSRIADNVHQLFLITSFIVLQYLARHIVSVERIRESAEIDPHKLVQ